MIKDLPTMTIRKVFVTGATGFIGKHLINTLFRQGYEVAALVRSASLASKTAGIDNVTWFTGDIRNYDDIASAFAIFRPEAVIHLVTYYAIMHRADEIGVMLDTNVKGTVNLLEASKEYGGVQLFVNTSSTQVYEPKPRRLTEEDAIRAQSLYAVTKRNAEEACSFYADSFGLPCVTLRLFPPYGPGDQERRLIPYVIGCILKNSPPNLTTGRQEWDFVYVDDIVSAFLTVLRSFSFKEGHRVYNIGTGQPISVRTIVEKIRKNLNSDIDLPWGSVPHRANEVWYNSADISRVEKELGWKPATEIDEGLNKTIAWYRDYYKNTYHDDPACSLPDNDKRLLGSRGDP
jgi:nucleoside-diphosphate-sugar epimerase